MLASFEFLRYSQYSILRFVRKFLQCGIIPFSVCSVFALIAHIAHKIEEKFPSNQDAAAILVSKWLSLCKVEEEVSKEILKKKEYWCKKQEIDSNLTNDNENSND